MNSNNPFLALGTAGLDALEQMFTWLHRLSCHHRQTIPFTGGDICINCGKQRQRQQPPKQEKP